MRFPIRSACQWLALCVLGSASELAIAAPAGAALGAPSPVLCQRTLRAEVVALEQAYVLNRFGAFNPAGMLYALRRDVVFSGHPRIADGTPVDDGNLTQAPGHVRLRPGKRPRPLVLRANEGDCLEVRFHNLLLPGVPEERSNLPEQYAGKVPAHMEDNYGTVYPANGSDGRNLVRAMSVSNDLPYTRAAAFHVNGLNLVPMRPDECPPSTAGHAWLCGTDGDNVGLNRAVLNPATDAALRQRLEQQGGQVYPGQSAIYRLQAVREGTYFAYSTGASVGGEGDGGQLGAGLFGAVNVQPRGARWYRSQVTHGDLQAAAHPAASGSHPFSNLDYDNARYASGPQAGMPILAMLDGDEIVHSDLNAIVVLTGEAPDHNDTTGPDRHCQAYAFGNSCGHAYREFTVIMHDEIKAVQAFAELEDESNPLFYIRDNMGVNYGAGGMGAMVLARNRRTGPARDCPECRAEEFFLSSWANGDPALLLRWSDDGRKPVGALYPDDPSNVHHSYLNDAVRFRNIHAGPKETHVFHLHAHQWVQNPSAAGSTYLDSQTISPGATFSYEIEFGGSGNRNLTPGDSIFHCHLYPHFAQGMWELWRTHDVFEDGSDARKLPDAEVAGGTESPALVPIPGSALAPMPTEQFAGYPFYIPGEPGHRPPQPPKDMDVVDGQPVNGGLPRHVLTGWENKGNLTERALANQDVLEAALAKGSPSAQLNARRVFEQNPNALYALAEEWKSIAGIRLLDEEGEPKERSAMAFHAGTLSAPGLEPVSEADDPRNPLWEQEARGYKSSRASTVEQQDTPEGPPVFWVNGRAPVSGAPFADPCPAPAPVRDYRVGVIQTELTVNRHGWFDPQARILSLEQDIKDIIDPNTRARLPEPLFFRANSGDCINFKHSNLVPNALALDDFQIYTPTDTIGQHIHLVKFDVTASDGAGNGWNYEDGTFSPEEVRERVHAYNNTAGARGVAPLALRTHPLFAAPCAPGNARCAALKKKGTCPANAAGLPLKTLAEKYPFCGAQRTVQRWYADPLLDPRNGRDYTLRTVFTHDHFGPSSHQQHGLYAALIVEPSNSVWLRLDARDLDWSKLCSRDAALRDKERGKLIGGANLSQWTIELDKRCKVRAPDPAARAVAANELREPLKLREDGGPTATRANIVSPLCLWGGVPTPQQSGSRKDSNPLDPARTDAKLDCPPALRAPDTRREYALALADFSILYNAALEPINPEDPDRSQIRLGHRQVALNQPRPLAISSEDPGTQLINYRNEPVPLRITERTPNTSLGGFDYRQKDCPPGRYDCVGDMANVFSTQVHASPDRLLATQSYGAVVSPRTRQILKQAGLGNRLDKTLADIERWRRDFNCALYPATQLPGACRLQREEPWRMLGDPATPVVAGYEGDPLYIRLIQGAQEAQHVFAMSEYKWSREPDNPRSGWTSAQPLGISEHMEFDIKVNPLATPVLDSLYFGSSVDQLWDGMWGLVRSYGRKDSPVRNGQAPVSEPVVQAGIARLHGLPGNPVPLPPRPADDEASLRVCPAGSPQLFFDISAVRACELTGGCGAGRRGIPYNQRLRLDDPNAILYVRNNRLPGEDEPKGFYDDLVEEDAALAEAAAPYLDAGQLNRFILTQLRQQVQNGTRPIEPLVLRAPAGACLFVKLRNHLPAVLPDGPVVNGERTTAHFSDNFMSMILDGFNYNQLRMSSSIGLSTPMLARYSRDADGANIGSNGRWDAGRDDPAQDRPQGNLIPPCTADAPDDSACTSASFAIWYAGEYRMDDKGRQVPTPVEFGALPLSSYADVIKHPAHGAIGALVIGPQGSRVCRSENVEEREADRRSDISATVCFSPTLDKDGNAIAEDRREQRRYRDLVLVLQDAVDAKIDGNRLENLAGAEEPDDYGAKAVNYRSEPLWGRRGGDPSVPFEDRNQLDYAGVLSSKVQRNDARRMPVSPASADQLVKAKGALVAARDIRCQAGIDLLAQPLRHVCDPETPLLLARAGSEVRLRIVHPGGHTRQQAIAVHGHEWDPMPYHLVRDVQPGNAGVPVPFASHADAVEHGWINQGSYNGVGPLMSANLLLKAGGRQGVAMDYLWRSQASFVFDGGTWGLLRVTSGATEDLKEDKP
ncbi:multicopper oxidase [Pseudomonas sp. ATCC 13867]|uniref:multicopper oxidase n=1 Tax=Pseudomonas sp. ATCC 13867 TaxID=1294143 RepID=UPI0002C4E975|nr:multicopper oxidase [Pseudomonas sp. ATCC 13867]AGI23130.1 multicopper oxidase [Pseudomonas sp. ATCC 13867]